MTDPRHAPLVFILILALIMAVPAATLARGPAVTVTAQGGTLTATPTASGAYLSLSIGTPDGHVFVTESAGDPVSLNLFGLPNYTLGDGQYIWEVRFTPAGAIDPGLRAAVLAGRESGDVGLEQQARQIEKSIVIQSGAFQVLNGQIVMGGETEPTGGSKSSSGASSPFRAAAFAEEEHSIPVDQVIPDDLIVQGSLCVGFDCVNNENFGFDTIRLKENNLRIKFEDTSVGTFPTNDWQLTANDSASGGASKFSIEDITGAKVPFTIRAGATTNSIFVDSTGRVGFRTSTPVLDLHVATSNTPAIRLEQNNSGGFTAQTWDIGANEANFFVRDVTGGSKLPLRIRPGAPTSSLDIAADGDVGIGTASPQVRLDVRGSSPTADLFGAIGVDPTNGPSFNFGYSGASFGRGSGFFNVRPDASATAPNPSIRFATANIQRVIIDNEGFLGLGPDGFNPTSPIHHQATGAILTAGGIWQNGSSRDLKTEIQSLGAEEARAVLVALSPVKYAAKADPAERHVGFVAEDVPDLVASQDRKTLSPMDIVAVVTRVLQEQQTTIEAQQRLIHELAAKVSALEANRAR